MYIQAIRAPAVTRMALPLFSAAVAEAFSGNYCVRAFMCVCMCEKEMREWKGTRMTRGAMKCGAQIKGSACVSGARIYCDEGGRGCVCVLHA